MAKHGPGLSLRCVVPRPRFPRAEIHEWRVARSKPSAHCPELEAQDPNDSDIEDKMINFETTNEVTNEQWGGPRYATDQGCSQNPMCSSLVV